MLPWWIPLPSWEKAFYLEVVCVVCVWTDMTSSFQLSPSFIYPKRCFWIINMLYCVWQFFQNFFEKIYLDGVFESLFRQFWSSCCHYYWLFFSLSLCYYLSLSHLWHRAVSCNWVLVSAAVAIFNSVACCNGSWTLWKNLGAYGWTRRYIIKFLEDYACSLLVIRNQQLCCCDFIKLLSTEY